MKSKQSNLKTEQISFSLFYPHPFSHILGGLSLDLGLQ